MEAGYVWRITWHNTHNPKYNTNDMSKELKHTPGPWSIRQESVWSVGTDHEMTALVYGCTDEEEEANAHLIAAAPDLLGALKAMVDKFDSEIHNEYDGTGMLEDRLSEANFARRIIAKAEGRAE
jgi:hypothetical protein